MITQFGVLPYRIDPERGLQILLVTSRDTGRWVIPKGNPIPLLQGHGTARREAYEEAGIEGALSQSPIGSYTYQKRRRSGEATDANVTVYGLRVLRQHSHWPERGQRAIRWFDPQEAALAVGEPELRELVLAFNPAGPDYQEAEPGVGSLKRFWIVALPAAGLIAAACYGLTQLL